MEIVDLFSQPLLQLYPFFIESFLIAVDFQGQFLEVAPAEVHGPHDLNCCREAFDGEHGEGVLHVLLDFFSDGGHLSLLDLLDRSVEVD